MRHTKLALATMAMAVLAACGGTSPSPGNQTPKIHYTAQVTFGDSLSDVGSYAVGTVAALGGGKFTINGDNTAINPALTGKNYTELLAAQLGVAAPCAAQTGLNGVASLGFSVPVVNHTGCFGYAQGGSRVTNPVGPGNANALSLGANNVVSGSPLGALTVPLVTQVANHLAASGGKFSGTEMVIVMAGGNDVLEQLNELAVAAANAGNTAGQAAGAAAGAQAGAQAFAASLVAQLAAGATNPQTAAQAIGAALATAAATPGATQTSEVNAAIFAAANQPGDSAVASPAVYGPMIAKATADATAAGNAAGATAGAAAGLAAANAYASANGPALVANMAAAGQQLVALVKGQILANGANYVTVNNLPDVATTPSGRSQPASTQALIAAMVTAFNSALTTGFAGENRVLLVDVYGVSHDQATNPAPYGLTNVTTPACDLTAAKNPLQSSLVCTGKNLIAGDVSHYSFADTVHPTPFNNLLLARYVAEQMVIKGWL